MAASVYIERDGGIWDAPTGGNPSSLAGMFRNLRDDGRIELFAGDMGQGRRFTSSAITAASTTLRLVPREPVRRFGKIQLTYGAGTSAGVFWDGVDAAILEREANSIPGVSALGGLTIKGTAGRFVVMYNLVGAVSHLTASGLGAVPDLYSRTSTVTAGDGTTRAVQLIEIEPSAIQLLDEDDLTAISAATMSATITAGTAASPESTLILFDKPPAGGYWTAGGDFTTAPISAFASAQEVQDAFNKVYGAGTFWATRLPLGWQLTRRTLGNTTDLTVDDSSIDSHAGLYGLADWGAIQKYGIGLGAGEPVKARALLRVVMDDGTTIPDIAEDIEISLDGAPAVAEVLTSTPTPSNVVGTYEATESISASRFVQVYDDSGTDKIRAGSAANSYDADGFITSAVSSGSAVTVYGTTGTLSGLSGLTTGNTQYLSEAGAVTETAPVAGIRQDLGEAVSDGKMTVNIQPPVVL